MLLTWVDGMRLRLGLVSRSTLSGLRGMAHSERESTPTTVSALILH